MATKKPVSRKKKANGTEPLSLKSSFEKIKKTFFSGRRALFALALYVIVCGMLMIPVLSGTRVREGDIAENDVTSPRTVTYTDTEATQELKRRVGEAVGTVYKISPQWRADLEATFSTLLARKGLAKGTDASALRAQLKLVGLDDASADRVMALSSEDLASVRIAVHAALSRASDGGIDWKDIQNLNVYVAEAAREGGLSSDILSSAQALTRCVKNHLEPDSRAMEQARREAEAAVPAVKRSIHENEIIVRRGERVERRHIDMMQQLDMLRETVSASRIAGFALMAMLVLFSMSAYAKTYALHVYRDEKRVAIFFTLIAIVIFGAAVLTPLFSGYLLGLWTGVFATLVCVLLDAGLALIATPLLALLIALSLGLKTGHIIVAMACGFAAHYFAARRHDRNNLLKSGFAVGVTSILCILALTAIQFAGLKQAFKDVVIFGSVNGFVSFVLASGLLSLFEVLFNVTTPRRLLELANPEEPLLKQLLVQAPGTYHHSIFVGNLAEAAAELIGADTLLVRIASYYHDIGKLKRPYFFTENRMQGTSLLNEMSPTLGALVISSHVKEGVEMIKDRNLPPEVISMVQEHHGTCLISFFYQQARAAAREGDEVSRERFRYPGPAPQTLESAVLMMADACEAAVRSLKEPSAKNIESQVNAIFEGRIMDKQFDDCNITLKQLDTMRRCYIRTLVGVYHSRIEYPDLKEMEAAREA